MRDNVVECRLDPGVTDGENYVLHRFRHRRQRRIAADTQHRLIAGINGVQTTPVLPFEQILHGLPPNTAVALRCAENRNRFGSEQ